MPQAPTVGIHTLGCKVNQYESAALAADLRARGLDAVEGRRRADLLVVNTCSVTAVADAKGRKLIRRLAADNPGAPLIVTGCYAELQAAELRAVPGVTAVVGNAAKPTLPDLLLELAHDGARAPLPALRRRCRAFLKVQDGCDNYCAYCTVPFARPTMASRPLPEAVAELRGLVAAGVQEVVLCGIRLGAYGHNGQGLPHLLRALAATGVPRLRLSSLEPWDVGPALVETIGTLDSVCPQLHLPAQSGDDAILACMGRRNTADDYLRLVAGLRRARPGLMVSTDLLVGFPGETEQAFERTIELAWAAAFGRLHVFSYSPRPGTRAAALPDQVPPEVKRHRSRRLRAVGDELARAFAAAHVGVSAPVLVESYRAGSCRGYTPDYLPVTFPGRPADCGRVLPVEITKCTAGQAAGRVVEESR